MLVHMSNAFVIPSTDMRWTGNTWPWASPLACKGGIGEPLVTKGLTPGGASDRKMFLLFYRKVGMVGFYVGWSMFRTKWKVRTLCLFRSEPLSILVVFFFYRAVPGAMLSLTIAGCHLSLHIAREGSQVSLSYIMMFRLMSDLARRRRLGTPARIDSARKRRRQRSACLKVCRLNFHSRGNPCLCPLRIRRIFCIFFFSGRLP